MIEFVHVIQDRLGFHARPVAQVAAVVRDHECSVQLACRGRVAAGDDLMALMGLDANRGDELTVHIEGPDEDAVASALMDVLP